MDWDWVVDFEILNETLWKWISQERRVIKDERPFTPKTYLIYRIIETNPSIIDVYPYYKSMNDEWYFSFNEETGCMDRWDFNILNPSTNTDTGNTIRNVINAKEEHKKKLERMDLLDSLEKAQLEEELELAIKNWNKDEVTKIKELLKNFEE